MRTIVDIPEEHIAALKALGERLQVSRAELMRRAVADYVARHRADRDDAAFGLWQAQPVDADALEARLREEWTR